MFAIKPIPIPPLTIVSVASVPKNPYAHLSGQRIRIGYYSKQDGHDCIWLVYPNGEYGETTDHGDIYRYFVIEQLSYESDFYGTGKPQLGALTSI